ncbi:hypothetical protein SLV14_003912 [Streptomyces sp. Je 1-4]|uniref:hypothetical protein n=1 Tax=Streptomyces TaxID=1883 RepID=UPI0021D95C94|nr:MULTISPECIES: hypothetical protein [unclassified Streptomyces]UYB41198.1 hypothetical protein SLV14_003912 [Streptomyces sp. Je 1-4]UZQ37376.1 hypothetical protein SLV14N_003912 [Streptomyces sp. Je 1-4] [Streptomyces sp. Je 1-4 4N24]UZQ44793.1 hypothetical protein SLV14NA_003912 [Streptomyces sp. Je 1-4] [Streptomyces sp. Je 1-4 4N24_ara]
MFTLAAAHAGIQGGQILGTLGASGAALAATVILVMGVKGQHKIKLDQMQAAIVGLVAGTLYATAASIWSTPANVTKGLTAAIQGGVGGNVGMGAIAVCLVAIIYGKKLKPRTAALFGIAAATIFAAAGGIWGVLNTTLAAFLNQALGVA